ncbi:thioredoxin-like protein [Hygrophoropsis aurantiaca]|uniref:Thioredoxin-like protein n=1 Tax=Hygrophoropsis aurantiaca TaxID=72124 RepID=A0ACB8APT2_9AGAM|nr:thioredoxin-like protein [Hygrophoropsis aurantiaca]
MFSHLYRAISSRLNANLFSSSAASSSSPSAYQKKVMAVKDTVDAAINGNTITVFSKTTCPFCSRAKDTIQKTFPDVKTEIVEIDELSEGSAIQNYLQEKTGQRTVPNIFINQKHVGGCDDFHSKLKNGQVNALLAAA